uniref:Uncharacterized protein n=1 Tax=Trypanosoma vivax (strain Y486) TaxID=1055687 RepID=G0TTK4_TRYVY|nr:hypothetical protein TVY486_0304560 [Trypanosoma vivax Y486]
MFVFLLPPPPPPTIVALLLFDHSTGFTKREHSRRWGVRLHNSRGGNTPPAVEQVHIRKKGAARFAFSFLHALSSDLFDWVRPCGAGGDEMTEVLDRIFHCYLSIDPQLGLGAKIRKEDGQNSYRRPPSRLCRQLTF